MSYNLISIIMPVDRGLALLQMIPTDLNGYFSTAQCKIYIVLRLLDQLQEMHNSYDDEERQFLISEQARKTLAAEERAAFNTPKMTLESAKEIPNEVTHKVTYGDTLEGLSLEYSVPIGRIRARNHIDGDFIYHLKEIIIPNPETVPLPRERTEEIMVEEFVAHMNYSEKDKKVARYYLVDTNWNMEQAMKEYATDLEWQRKNKPAIVTQNLQPNRSQGKEIKRYYEMQELRHKKAN